MRRALDDSFEHASLDVTARGDAVPPTLPRQEKPVGLQAVGPAQFVQSDIYVLRFGFRLTLSARCVA